MEQTSCMPFPQTPPPKKCECPSQCQCAGQPEPPLRTRSERTSTPPLTSLRPSARSSSNPPSSSVHALPGQQKDFPTPCHRNRHSFLLNSSIIPRDTERAEIRPLSDEVFCMFACSLGTRHLPNFPALPFNTKNLKTQPWSQESSVFFHGSHIVFELAFRDGTTSSSFRPQNFWLLECFSNSVSHTEAQDFFRLLNNDHHTFPDFGTAKQDLVCIKLSSCHCGGSHTNPL